MSGNSGVVWQHLGMDCHHAARGEQKAPYVQVPFGKGTQRLPPRCVPDPDHPGERVAREVASFLPPNMSAPV